MKQIIDDADTRLLSHSIVPVPVFRAERERDGAALERDLDHSNANNVGTVIKGQKRDTLLTSILVNFEKMPCLLAKILENLPTYPGLESGNLTIL